MLCVNRFKIFCKRIEIFFKVRFVKINMFFYYLVLMIVLFMNVIDLILELVEN